MAGELVALSKRDSQIRDHKDLEVWRVSMQLVRAVYAATTSMPSDERFGLTAQMRSAAVSIPSNIAEGYGRGSRTDYCRFVRVARGSAAELETQILIAQSLGMLAADDAELLALLDRVKAMLHALIRSLDGGALGV